MLRLPDDWVWDSWYVDDGTNFHAFYLKAPRSLGDPELRHHAATIGHSVSTDLSHWTTLPDALTAGLPGAPDALATWTGSVVADQFGMWHMFYTGIAHDHTHSWQRILHATSDDLNAWVRDESFVLDADPRWYLSFDADGEQHWRDPWVFYDDATQQWHMLITAYARTGEHEQTGVIGHATSSNLVQWTVQPPLAADTRMRQLEVTQTLAVAEQFVVAWCMLRGDTHVPGMHAITGTWTAPAGSLLGPFHTDAARPIEVPGLYAGRVVVDRNGELQLLAFVDVTDAGEFGGYICDPITLELGPDGTLQPKS